MTSEHVQISEVAADRPPGKRFRGRVVARVVALAVVVLAVATVCLAQENISEVTGFIQAAGILVWTGGIYALGTLFDVMPGQAGFMQLSLGLGVVALVYLLLNLALRRQTAPPKKQSGGRL